MSSSSDSERHLAAIHARLEHLGLPPLARDWLIKAIHPAATHDCPGIPDMYEGQVITPDYRDTLVIGPAATVTGDWDLCIIQVPGDVNGFVAATGPAGTDFTTPIQATPPVDCTAVTTINQICSSGPSCAITTFSSAAPAVTNVNTLQVTSEPWQWRRRYAGITAYMTASALNDQGTVFASSFASGYQKGQTQFIGASGLANYGVQTNGSALALTGIHDYNVPLDETSLQLLSPKPYVAPARHGVYVPARFLSTNMANTATITSCEPLRTVNTGGGLFSLMIPAQNQTDNVPSVALPRMLNGAETVAWPSIGFHSPSGLTPNGTSCVDSGHSDMTVQVIIFRGLANAARITIRSYYGLEVVPRVSSTFRQFAKPSAPYSEVALRTYAALVHEMAYAYPASYNSFGDLLSVIHKVASVLYPPLRSLVGSIPVVGPVAKMVGDAVFKGTAPHLSETQRVSVSDPRPVARPALAVKAKAKKAKRSVSITSRSTRR